MADRIRRRVLIRPQADTGGMVGGTGSTRGQGK